MWKIGVYAPNFNLVSNLTLESVIRENSVTAAGTTIELSIESAENHELQHKVEAVACGSYCDWNF